MRVAFVPRSAEIQPLFWRFVTFTPTTNNNNNSYITYKPFFSISIDLEIANLLLILLVWGVVFVSQGKIQGRVGNAKGLLNRDCRNSSFSARTPRAGGHTP